MNDISNKLKELAQDMNNYIAGLPEKTPPNITDVLATIKAYLLTDTAPENILSRGTVMADMLYDTMMDIGTEYGVIEYETLHKTEIVGHQFEICKDCGDRHYAGDAC